MPRRLNFTGRQKIPRDNIRVRLHRNGSGLAFDAEVRLAECKFDQPTPPRVFVEAYRGASTLWKRFDFGRVGATQPPDDRSLNEFVVPEGILFRVKVTAEGPESGKLLAGADAIRPTLPGEADDRARPLIDHMPSDDIGEELWRVEFEGDRPLLLVNQRVPMGVEQFLSDWQFRAVFAPAVMRQVLGRILIVEPGQGDDDDADDWRTMWIDFAEKLPGVGECPDAYDQENKDNLREIEEWIDTAVEAFCARSNVLTRITPV